MKAIGNFFFYYRKITFKEGNELSEREGLRFFEISAKKDINIKHMFYNSAILLPFFDDFRDFGIEKMVAEIGN